MEIKRLAVLALQACSLQTLNQQVTGSIPVRLTIFEAISTHFLLPSFKLFSILSSLLNKIPDFSLDFA